MTDIKRYEMYEGMVGSTLSERGDGDYVLYTDHIAALEAVKAEEQKTLETMVEMGRQFEARLEAVKATVKPDLPYDLHRYAVTSSDYIRPYLLGAYPTLDNARRAQDGRPDLWEIFIKMDDLTVAIVPSPALEANQQVIEKLRAQNEWLKDRLAYLQLPTHMARHREEWLVDCGMPAITTEHEVK